MSSPEPDRAQGEGAPTTSSDDQERESPIASQGVSRRNLFNFARFSPRTNLIADTTAPKASLDLQDPRSRRGVVKAMAGTALIAAGLLFTPNRILAQLFRREGQKSPEVLTESNYVVNDLAISNGRLVAAVTFNSDNTQHFISGDLDPATMQIQAKDKGAMPFTLRGVAVSPTNKDLVTALGDDGAGNGQFRFSSDGAASWSATFKQSGAMFVSAQITPDNKFVQITGLDPNNLTQSLYYSFDLTTLKLSQLTLSSGSTPPGFPTNFSVASSPASYTNYAIAGAGYTENTFTPGSNSLSTKLWNSSEGIGTARLLQYATAGSNNTSNNHIGLTNNYEYGLSQLGNSPDRGVGKYYDNINNQPPALPGQPKESLYPELTGNTLPLVINSVAEDDPSDLAFMVVGAANGTGYNIHVESFSKSNPTDMTQHNQVPEDGSYPVGGNTGLTNTFAAVLSSGTERVLLFDSVSNQPANEGLYYRRITNGVNSTDQWQKITVSRLLTPTPGSGQTKINLPSVSNQSTQPNSPSLGVRNR